MNKDLSELMTKAFLLRGKIISDTIYLERCIDEYMSRYFCDTKEKQKDLIETVFATKRMVFENKRLVFDYIIKKSNPGFLEKYPSFKKDVIDIIEQRNVLAHYLLNSSDEGISKHLTQVEFINFRDGVEKTIYDNEKKSGIENKIEKCIMAMHELLQ